MSTLPYTARVIISSIALIICGFLNFILILLGKAVGIISTVNDIVQSNVDYSEVGTWTGFLSKLNDVKAVFTLSVNVLTIVQIIAGIVGIIIAVGANKKSYINKKFADFAERFISAPFMCGIAVSILGGISYLSLLLAKSSSAFFYIVMFVTVLAVPIIYTVFSYRFRKGDKS